jgi:hypothetical protein
VRVVARARRADDQVAQHVHDGGRAARREAAKQRGAAPRAAQTAAVAGFDRKAVRRPSCSPPAWSRRKSRAEERGELC